MRRFWVIRKEKNSSTLKLRTPGRPIFRKIPNFLFLIYSILQIIPRETTLNSLHLNEYTIILPRRRSSGFVTRSSPVRSFERIAWRVKKRLRGRLIHHEVVTIVTFPFNWLWKRKCSSEQFYQLMFIYLSPVLFVRMLNILTTLGQISFRAFFCCTIL